MDLVVFTEPKFLLEMECTSKHLRHLIVTVLEVSK